MRLISSAFVEPDAFTAHAARLARREDADLFLSGQGRTGENTSLIGINPCEELVVTEKTGRAEIKDFAFSGPGPCLGFLSYTYGLARQGISFERTAFPLGHFKKYAALILYDQALKKLDLYARKSKDIRGVEKILASDPAKFDFQPPRAARAGFSQSLDRDAYVRAVKKTLEHIRDGHTYQLNLSVKFSLELQDPDAPALFFHLLKHNPARFYAWFKSGPYRIISTSPERFLRVSGGQVLSQPIKGTLAIRGTMASRDTPAFGGHLDESLVARLTSSPKESAELSMIVDLIRNDISSNCEYGSVQVDGHKSTFVVDNLLHMYSNVRGRLKKEITCVDLLLDAFPGGSVTGCPKKRTLEIIEELEPHSRDVYCGGFFAIRDEKNMDSSVAIRTGYLDPESSAFHFFAGSGIVIDSDPLSEYTETLAKAEKFLRIQRP
ncbi:MAG: chorismate-binding protein [Thermodesulfobacteriota bacterium]|nr:chorismate-binding protein [Thermodesulfobacteriota bacterium]